MAPEEDPATSTNAALCRAARVLARVDRATLSARSGVEAGEIKRFEEGLASLSRGDVERLHRALEALGVIFIPEDAGGGAGVRLRFGSAETGQIAAWEAEGGTPADDEVP